MSRIQSLKRRLSASRLDYCPGEEAENRAQTADVYYERDNKVAKYTTPSIISRNTRRSRVSRAISGTTNRTRRSRRPRALQGIEDLGTHPVMTDSASWRAVPASHVSYMTTEKFFNGISHNPEYGKDFLREMDLPLCNSKPVQLPLNLRTVHPGRCIELSVFGHSAIMGFQCEECTRTQSNGGKKAGFIDQNKHIQLGPNNENELFSITLAFYNNADKVVQHKGFYLSLLSHSLETVKQSFAQPSLLYTYLLFKNYYKQPLIPVFTPGENGLAMFLLFDDAKTLHVNEQCIRLAADNLIYYSITFDCLQGTYVMALRPEYRECQKINIAEDDICAAVAALDYSDEIKEAIIENTNKICSM